MNSLNRELLHSSGSYATLQPERREIKWYVLDEEGNEKDVSAVVYVRKRSFATISAEAKFSANDSQLAARIVSSIVDDEGQPIFTLEDIMGNDEHGPICESLGMALLAAIWDVNGLSKKPDPKQSATTTSSGASLSSPESVEAQ
jgi:hypothetical protein